MAKTRRGTDYSNSDKQSVPRASIKKRSKKVENNVKKRNLSSKQCSEIEKEEKGTSSLPKSAALSKSVKGKPKNVGKNSKNDEKLVENGKKSKPEKEKPSTAGNSSALKSDKKLKRKAKSPELKKSAKIPPKKPKLEEKSETEDDEEIEWEEVESLPSTSEKIAKNEPLEITLQSKDKNDEMKKAINRELNRILRENREKLHQVCLLAFLSHLTHLSQICNDDLLKSVAFSLFPKGFLEFNSKNLTKEKLGKFLKWFKSAFLLSKNFYSEDDYLNLKKCLIDRFEKKTVYNYKELALIFVIFLRALNLPVRFVLCLSEKNFENCIIKNLLFNNSTLKIKESKSKNEVFLLFELNFGEKLSFFILNFHFLEKIE